MSYRELKYYNIKADSTSTFGFSYDNLGRLTNTNRYVGAGATASSTFTERNLSYDANGNILTLSRYGASATTPEDNFTYTYNGNKLMNLVGTNGGTALSGANYTYDGNGNMTHDGRMNLDVTYDIFGMPQSVQQIGTDGVNNGVKVLVTDNREARKVSRIKGNVDINSVKSRFILPHDVVLKECINVLDRTIANGGLREESSIIMNNGSVIQGQTGSMPIIENGEQTANASLPNLPKESTSSDVEATIHSHPTTVQEYEGRVYPQSASRPSPTDKNTFMQIFRLNQYGEY